jgi:5-methylcytosine-specific restriction endonuclease McrA
MVYPILAVDRAWNPDKWIDAETAVHHYCKGHISQFLGDERIAFRGGINALTGKQSMVEIGPIAVIDAEAFRVKDFTWAPLPSRETLFRRDHHMCAYCGETFAPKNLGCDHVIPKSRKGAYSWANLVTACKSCNSRKADRTPEEARMPLLYLPYKPSRFEALILENRKILADQMEFLLQRVPNSSRFKSRQLGQ